MSSEASKVLRTLSKTSRELQGIEAKVDGLREKRNQAMYDAVNAGATERKVAEAALVDPAFVHRTVVRVKAERAKGAEDEEKAA